MRFTFLIILMCILNMAPCVGMEDSLQGKKPFYVMTIVRDAQSVMLHSERRCIENIIELLCGNKVEEEDKVLLELIEKDEKYVASIKGMKSEDLIGSTDIKAEYNLSVYNKDISSIKQSYDALKRTVLTYIEKNSTKIEPFIKENGLIVLNEMFFGKEAPYIQEEYGMVCQEFLELSGKIRNKVFCINVLGNVNYLITESEIEQVKKLESRMFVRNDVKFDPLTTSSSERTPKDKYIDEAYKKDSKIVLENASHAFLEGKPAFVYKKGTYYGECDTQLDRNIPYIFGDGEVHFFSEFEWLGKYISVQICRDLACGVGIPVDSKSIHIFQSNSLGIHQGQLPKKVRTLIHADPKFSVQYGDFYCNRSIFNLDEELPMPLRWENGGNFMFSLKFNLCGTWYYVFVREVSNEFS